MNVSSLIKWTLVGIGAASTVAFGGCSANVTTFGTCEFNGNSYDVGEQFPDSDGCNTCQCDADGSVSCTQMGCAEGCVVGGVLYDVGETFVAENGCDTCRCSAPDQFECTTLGCVDCDGPPPECGPGGPACETYPVCVDETWVCQSECDDCDLQQPPPCPAPPPGCFWDGPYCDDGVWTCGELICEECAGPPPVCPQPGNPECWAEPVCSPFGWDCEVFCGGGTCEDQFPSGYETAVILVFDYCGCMPNSPCSATCPSSQICGESGDPDACFSCVEQQANATGQCVVDAVFGPECQNSPQCSAYIDCVLSGG